MELLVIAIIGAGIWWFWSQRGSGDPQQKVPPGAVRTKGVQVAAPAATAWEPSVDVVAHRDLVFRLARRLQLDNDEIRSNIREFLRVADHPTDSEQLLHAMHRDGQVSHRPWIWLTKAVDEASNAGDHEMACAAFYWAYDWNDFAKTLPMGAKLDLALTDLPQQYLVAIAVVALPSADAIAAETVIVGDETGQITAGMVGAAARQIHRDAGLV